MRRGGTCRPRSSVTGRRHEESDGGTGASSPIARPKESEHHPVDQDDARYTLGAEPPPQLDRHPAGVSGRDRDHLCHQRVLRDRERIRDELGRSEPAGRGIGSAVSAPVDRKRAPLEVRVQRAERLSPSAPARHKQKRWPLLADVVVLDARVRRSLHRPPLSDRDYSRPVRSDPKPQVVQKTCAR